MSQHKLIIRLDNDKIDLTSSNAITYDQTNLPKHEFSFTTRKPIFWELEIKQYDPISETLIVSVIDYSLPINTRLPFNKPEYIIKNMCFEKLSWERFESLITSYSPHKLKDTFFNHPLSITVRMNQDTNNLMQSAPNLFFPTRHPVREEKEIELKVKYEESIFNTSKIVFTVRLKQYRLVRDLEILNSHLRPELEYIKPYFVNRLGKSFVAKLKLILLDNVVESIVAKSDDINNINENLVNSITIDSVLDLKNFKNDREDKVLYNYRELSNEDKKLSILNITATNILEIFIEKANVKNVKQLEYLSREKQTLNDRILFTVKPFFGFVFHVFGNTEYFIWELLNSHATYIWKSNISEKGNDLKMIVEQAIATIKNEGREAYKKYYKSIKDPNYHFGLIEHSSSHLTDAERFNEWKNKLESFIQSVG